jgi:hypothetical protein
VTDIFREVEEDVRRERYEQLWKKYGDYAIAGAALIIIAVAGFQLWRVYDQRARAKASDEYMVAEQLFEAGQASEAAEAFAKLQKTAPGGYAAIAKLQVADSMQAAGNVADAISVYKQIIAGKDDMLGAIARIHAGWAIVDTASKSDVENLVSPLTASSSPWHAMAREILAYADYRTGDTQNALREYQDLLNDPNAPPQLRVRSEVMATFLKAGGDKNYGTVPEPSAPPDAATSTPPSEPPAQPRTDAPGQPKK